MKSALTIAGSDSSGGAGIQADIKTMCANHVFATSAITALTAQNTLGVTGIMDVTPEFLAQELDAVFTSGARLISEDAIETLKKELLPLATLITPNIPEAEVLSEMKITDEMTMVEAAKKISETFGCGTLVKGGHQINDANDLLYRNNSYTGFKGKRINNPNTHGTGCTLSSAIASNLAKGFDLDASVERAKDYISGALNAMLDLGKGSGPMDHSFAIDNEYTKEFEA